MSTSSFTRSMANFIYSKKKELGFRPDRGGYKGHWRSPPEYDMMYNMTVADTEGTDCVLVEDMLIDAYQLAREGYLSQVQDLIAKAYDVYSQIEYD